MHPAPVFIAALSTTAKTWKQPKGPSEDEWIKMWCVHTHTHTHTSATWEAHVCMHIYVCAYTLKYMYIYIYSHTA